MDHTALLPELGPVVCLQEPRGKGGVGPLKPSWAHRQSLAQHASDGPGKALFAHGAAPPLAPVQLPVPLIFPLHVLSKMGNTTSHFLHFPLLIKTLIFYALVKSQLLAWCPLYSVIFCPSATQARCSVDPGSNISISLLSPIPNPGFRMGNLWSCPNSSASYPQYASLSLYSILIS